MIHAVDIYPTLAALAGASTAKCKPLDGINVWDTIAEGKPSPRTEIIYNVEPFRAGIRQGDWKLIWRTMLPPALSSTTSRRIRLRRPTLAAANPEKVAAMQERLKRAGKEAAKPLALLYIMQTGMKATVPLLPTDEGFYTDADDDPTPPKIGTVGTNS